MIIQIATGTGAGPTSLAAFDAALYSAGVANYNLLPLSSVIPPDSTIEVREGALTSVPGNWGDRLYVVIAEMRADRAGQEAWGGIGWVQDKQTGKGLFVEHEGHDEESVRNDIAQSLASLMSTRHIDFGKIRMVVRGSTCINKPVCSLVIAVYQAQEWEHAYEN